MPDRRQLIEDLVLARSIAVAMLPADDHEPSPTSPAWPVGIGKVLVDAGRARDLHDKRDAIVLAGAHVIGWLEAVDEALDDLERDPADGPK